MKVYSVPDECPAPEIDYSQKFDHAKEIQNQLEHSERLRDTLREMGYTGKYTGYLFSTPRGDGKAVYMIADGNPSCLIHLPYGDAWHDPDVQYIPKKEIVRRSTSLEENSKASLKWIEQLNSWKKSC